MNEQQPQNERVAILENAVAGIEKGLGRLENKLDTLLDSIEKKFPTRNEYAETIKRLESRLDNQAEEINKLSSDKGKVPVWATTIISVLVAVIGALIGIHFHG